MQQKAESSKHFIINAAQLDIVVKMAHKNKQKNSNYYTANKIQIIMCVHDVFVSLHFVQLSEKILYRNHH